MAINLIQWAFTTAEKYKALPTKDENTLYFITDTKEIYKGSTTYTEPTVFYTAPRSATGALGKIYFDDTTLAGSVWNGTTWKEVIAPVAQTIDKANPTVGPVSGAAVKAYIDAEVGSAGEGFITDLKWKADTKEVVFAQNGTDHPVKLTKLLTGVSYDGATGKWQFKDSEDTVISEINVPLDNFVSSGIYDATKKALVLTMANGSTVEIPATDLVALYTATDSATVDLTISNTAEGNVIKADVKISATAGNSLVANADGLYVNAPDVSGKLDKVTAGKADEIITANADGTVKPSGKKVGGATLNASPDANTVATEAAVFAIKTAIENSTSTTYVAKASISTTIPTTGAVDTKVASEKAVADALTGFKTTADAAYVPKTNIVTSAAGFDKVTPSAEKVASEKAILELLSWQELV